jgi:putative spermidine/putrescine transport system substrate-binding protein
VKKFLVFALVITLLVTGIGLVGTSAVKADDKPVLVVSTWGYNQDLLDKNITFPFEEMYNVDIVYETGNNSERLSKMIERGDNPGVDVVHFADSYAYTAYQEGLLQPYDPDLLTNLGDLYDWAVDPIGGQYAVGYAVSSYGLFYRTDEIEEPITSWKDLWRSDVKGYVSVPDMGTTNGPATLLMMARAWGGDLDNLEPAWEHLPDLVDQLLTTYVRSSELLSLVQQEEVWVGAVPSFSWGGMLDTGLPLEYVIPEEGLAGFQSVVSVVKGTENEELAHQYIDFILSHDVQLAEAMDLVDSPTNETVEVPDDVAAKLTYGEDTIDSLVFLDPAFVSDHLEEWITRWNELLVQ